ncbi:MAG: phosphotransferase family protein [Myxococcota bacterium]
MDERPEPEDLERASRALGVEPVAWRTVARGGQTAASRWIATLPDGSTSFVKIAFTQDTAAWVRDEHLFYAQHRGLPFIAEMLGWSDDGERPVLVLEGLSDARWPPPWRRHPPACAPPPRHDRGPTAPSAEIPPVSQSQFDRTGWPEVAGDLDAFLALGLCDARWIEAHLATLTDAAHSAVIEGDALLHMDVRSDNLCLRDGRAMLVDWNFACTGNPRFDLAAWLPSLHAEGGPAPEQVVPPADDMAAFASVLAGYFAAHAARPDIPEAPHVRPLQRKQARTALPWAARALALPTPAPTA